MQVPVSKPSGPLLNGADGRRPARSDRTPREPGSGDSAVVATLVRVEPTGRIRDTASATAYLGLSEFARRPLVRTGTIPHTGEVRRPCPSRVHPMTDRLWVTLGDASTTPASASIVGLTPETQPGLRFVRPMSSAVNDADDSIMLTELLQLTDSMQIALVGAIGFALLLSTFLGYRIGGRKDRPILGAALGGFLTLPGLLVLSTVPPKEPEFY